MGALIFAAAISLCAVCGIAKTPSHKHAAAKTGGTFAVDVVSTDKAQVSITWEQFLAGSVQLTLATKAAPCKQAEGFLKLTDLPNTQPFQLKLAADTFNVKSGSPVRVPIVSSSAVKSRPTPGTYLATATLRCVDSPKAPTTASIPIKLVVSPPRLGPDKVYLVSKRSAPWSAPWTRSLTIPLSIPAPLDLVSKDNPRRIGFLHRDPRELATVDWISTQADASGPTVTILINGLSRAGKYEGDISLQGVEEKGALTSIVVMTKDKVGWPILVIVLGIVLTWVAKWYLGMLRVILTLEKQSRELPKLLEVNGQPPPSAGGYSVQKDLAKRQSEINSKIAGIFSFWTTSLTGNPDYKDVVDQLSTMKSQLVQFSDLAAAQAALKMDLADAEKLQMPEAMILDETRDKRSALCVLSDALLQGREICVDQIVGTTNRMIAASNALHVWTATLTELQTTSTQFLAATDRNDPQDQGDLKEAASHLILAWLRLWRATAAEDVAAISASGSDLESADIVMATITARHRGPMISGIDSSKSLAFAARRGNILFHLTDATPLLAEPGLTSDQRRIRSLATAIRLGDLASVLLALAIALVTGLNSFYLGKSFGTVQDYAALFLWAAGTKVGLDLLTTVTDRLISYV